MFRMNNYYAGITDFLTFIITITGFYFAYFQWFKSNRERKFHLIKLLKVQLDCLGPWVGSNDEGYGRELSESQKYDNANPTKVIYRTGSSPLINSILLEQMSDVPEYIIGEISQLHYDFMRIESIQEYRNLLTSSNIKLSSSIKQKHKKALYQSQPYDDFLKTLTKEEGNLVQTLVNYGKTLHCDVIGNRSKGARLHVENIKLWINTEIGKYSRPQKDFVILSFFCITLIALSISAYFKFLHSNLGLIILLCFILTIQLSIWTRAIIINNDRIKF